MSKKYRNPPIMEVVCEFRFPIETPWDITIPGLLYEKVKEKFPHREPRIIQHMEIKQARREVEHKFHTEERIFFFDSSKKTFIQAGHRILSINRLRPYISWNEFKPNIEKAFTSLLDIVNVKNLQRIGLRYINKIEIPKTSVDLETYFEFRPFLGSKLPQNIVDFIVGCMFAFNNGQDMCKVELKSAVPDTPEHNAFMLDLDYFLAKPQTVSADQALEWVDDAHDKVEKIFEGCITDELRKIFGEE